MKELKMEELTEQAMSEEKIPTALDAPRRPSRRVLWMCGLALLAFAVHAGCLFGGFVFDDTQNLLQRGPANLSRIPQYFVSNQSAAFGSNFYRPVQVAWNEIAFSLFGAHALPWHLMNLLLHVACVLLLFGVALAVTESEPVAVLSAALFAVHPAGVEAVSWISAVGDLLMCAFLLLSALCLLRWIRAGGWPWWAASFAAAAAAMLCKEPAVMLPLVLAGTVFVQQRKGGERRPVLWALLPFFGLSLAYLVVRQSVLTSFSHPLTQARAVQVFYTIPAALLFYVRHLLWPSMVLPLYPLSIVPGWQSREFWLPLAAVAGIAVLLGALLWRAAGWRKALACAAWLVAPLAPALYLKALAPLELVHDRFLYTPLVGFCMGAALVAWWLCGLVSAKPAQALAVASLLLLLPMAAQTIRLTMWWQSDRSLFTHNLEVTPDSGKALDCLSSASLQEGRYEEALPLLQRALALNPRDNLALFGMARIAWVQHDDATAEIYLRRALSAGPRYDMWLHLVSVELHRNRLDLAEDAAQRAIAMNPQGAGVHLALGAVELIKGDRPRAAAEFQQELRNYPESEQARVGLERATGQATP
jgi:tetratricopeptide (TPR) repeat protein